MYQDLKVKLYCMKNNLIIDIGSENIKAGFVESNEPTYFPNYFCKQYFPSVKDQYDQKILEKNKNVEFFNDRLFDHGRYKSLNDFEGSFQKIISDFALDKIDKVLFP